MSRITKQADRKNTPPDQTDKTEEAASKTPEKVSEIGGPKGPEPTRYGDWERKGRCIDF